MSMNGIKDLTEVILESSLTFSLLEIIGVHEPWNGALSDSYL